MNKRSLRDIILIEFGKFFEPILALKTPTALAEQVKELGWNFDADSLDADIQGLISEAQAVVDLAKSLGESQDDNVAQVKELLEKIPKLFKRIKEDLPKVGDTILNLQGVQGKRDALEQDVPLRFNDFLFYEYFKTHRSKAFGIFYPLGVFTMSDDPEDGGQYRDIRWSRMPSVLYEPHILINDLYKWSNDFQSDIFLERAQVFSESYNIAGDIQVLEQQIRANLDYDIEFEEIRVPVYSKEGNGAAVEVEINAAPLPKKNSDKAGLLLYPSVIGNLVIDQNINENWNISLAGDLELKETFGIEIRPDKALKVQNNIASNSIQNLANGQLVFKATQKAPEGLTSIFGSIEDSATFVGYEELSFKAVVSSIQGDFFLAGEIEILGFTIRIDPTKGDGFISKLLKNIQVESISDLAIGVSNDEGVYFRGSSGLEIIIPIHKKIGPIFLETIFVFVGFDGEISFSLGAAFTAELGPIFASVDRIGTRFPFDFKEEAGGNYGPVTSKDVGFVSPTAIGINLDTPALQGGGFLEIDIENERYAGILSLSLQKKIELTAIGLITTRLPNGKKGFSMLVSISVVFRPGIQLSFGFTLNGVGGLIGVNRTMKVDVLRERFRDGAIDSIMFPEDPIQNAERIISDLRAVFPPREKHFVIGPFLKLGWGGFIEADLGVFLEFPFNGRIVLLGGLSVILPTRKKPLIVFNIDILGDLNFAEQYVLLLGTLRDSRILQIKLNGDFAFLLSWGSEKVFAFTVGGFHPRYTNKPEKLYDLKRISAEISRSAGSARIQLVCQLYQAVTSNSFQIGFRTDLYGKWKSVTFTGYLGFDALIQFDPFRFEVDIYMGVEVKWKGRTLFGVDLAFSLSGPAPWRIRGYAKIKILFFKIKVKFKLEWGKKQTFLPTIPDPLPDLVKQLNENTNWGSIFPENVEMMENLKSLKQLAAEQAGEEEALLVIHPSGALSIRQTLLPLDLTVEKLGNARLETPNRFKIDSVKVGANTLNTDDYYHLREDFSRGQYELLSDEEKLTTPEFESFKAGIELASDKPIIPDDFESFTLEYENIIIQDDLSKNEEIVVPDGLEILDWEDAVSILKHSAAIQKWQQKSGQEYDLDISGIDDDLFNTTTYWIKDKADLSNPNGIEMIFETYGEAKMALRDLAKSERYQIVEVIGEEFVGM